MTPSDAHLLQPASCLFDHPVSRAAARAYLNDSANLVLVALDHEGPIGFVRGTALAQLRSARRQMLLYEIEVARAHRRRGVGRALVEALIAYCRRRNFEEIFVITSPRNRPAVALYRSTGAVTETASDRMFVYRLGRVRRRPKSQLSTP